MSSASLVMTDYP